MKQNRTPEAKKMLKQLIKMREENLQKLKIEFFKNQKVETSTKSSRWN